MWEPQAPTHFHPFTHTHTHTHIGAISADFNEN